ncbi:hypothetical protein ABFX02_13G026400 [Erythranthe guttata]
MGKCCISIWTICIVIILTPVIVILSLSFVTHKPRLYIQDMYVPALKTTTGSSNATRLNTFIFIDLKLQNVMPFNGLRYGDLKLTFFYASNTSLPAVANYTAAGFYQGLKKTAHRRVVVRTSGLPWDDAFMKVSGGSVVDIRVELATTVKLRRCGRYLEREAMVVKANVRLDGSGEKVNKKTVRLVG